MLRFTTLGLILCACLALVAHEAKSIGLYYVGPDSGDWHDPANWGGTYPGFLSDVYIDGDPSRNVQVSMDRQAEARSLVIDEGDALGFGANTRLDLDDARVAGLLAMANPGARLNVRDYLLIDQTGRLQLGPDEAAATVTGSDNPSAFLENYGTISGAGTLGERMSWVNYGVIESNLAGERLSLLISGDFANSRGNGTNLGIIRATSGSTLILQEGEVFSSSIDNTFGQIVADVGSTVEVQTFVRGGVLRAIDDIDNPGVIKLREALLEDVVLEGQIESYRLALFGDIENRGIVTHQGYGSFDFAYDTTWTGGGTWQFVTPAALRTAFYAEDAPLVVNEDNTFRGGLVIDLGEGTFVNRGVMETTTMSNGLLLRIGDGGITNSGIIRGINQDIRLEGAGELLNFEGDSRGVIEVAAGQRLVLNGPSVHGGVLRALPADDDNPHGVIENDAPQTLLQDLTIEGELRSQHQNLRLSGVIDNRGELVGNFLLEGTSVSLKGGGIVDFASLIHSPLPGTTTLFNVDNTLRGTGFAETAVHLVNDGRVEVSGGQQSWNGALIENRGIMKAYDRGHLDAGVVDNRGGRIVATGASQMELGGVYGGTIETDVDSVVTVSNGASNFDASFYQVENLGHVQLDAASLLGEIANHGTITVRADVLLRPGVTRLTGGGVMHFPAVGPRLEPGSGATTLINDSAHSLTGNVDIHVERGQFVNRGSIISDGHSTASLFTNVDAIFSQEGLLAARGESQMTLTIGGSDLFNRGIIEAEGGSHITTFTWTHNMRDATIDIRSGSRFEAFAITNQRQALITGGGTIEAGPGFSSTASTFQNSGTVAPGDGVGTMHIIGNFEQNEFGTLAIEIGGAAEGMFDQLAIVGRAMLGGVLDVTLLDGYAPASGDRFDIITATYPLGAPISNTFDDLQLAELSTGLRWQVEYTPDLVSLFVTDILPGDYNADGRVDLADYTLWRDHLGASDESSINNAGDGLAGVGPGDYTVWRENFGEVRPIRTFETSTVPEPSALFVSLWGVAACLLTAKRSVLRR